MTVTSTTGRDMVRRLAEIQLPTSDSESRVRLGALWAESPAVLLFLRHFG